MASLYTLKIVVEDTAPLDGTTPLDIKGAGVVVNRTDNRTATITLPAGTALGRIDPGQVIENQDPAQNGVPMLMTAWQVSSDAPYSSGDLIELSRISPPATSGGAGYFSVISSDLSSEPMPGGWFAPEVFPVDHELAISSGAIAGPHEIIIQLQCLNEQALGQVVGTSSTASTGPSPLAAIGPVWGTANAISDTIAISGFNLPTSASAYRCSSRYGPNTGPTPPATGVAPAVTTVVVLTPETLTQAGEVSLKISGVIDPVDRQWEILATANGEEHSLGSFIWEAS